MASKACHTHQVMNAVLVYWISIISCWLKLPTKCVAILAINQETVWLRHFCAILKCIFPKKWANVDLSSSFWSSFCIGKLCKTKNSFHTLFQLSSQASFQLDANLFKNGFFCTWAHWRTKFFECWVPCSRKLWICARKPICAKVFAHKALRVCQSLCARSSSCAKLFAYQSLDFCATFFATSSQEV